MVKQTKKLNISLRRLRSQIAIKKQKGRSPRRHVDARANERAISLSSGEEHRRVKWATSLFHVSLHPW
ncbi:hypothetical protein Bca4012_048030 [Brassica carinata]